MERFTPDLHARSHWAALSDVRTAEISPPAGRVDAQLTVPGSKSFTNRALIIGALAKGTSRLTGILRSDDSFWCVEALKKLGAHIEVAGDMVQIEGIDGDWPVKEASVYVGAAGTTARFLPGALAAAKSGRWIIEGSTSMSNRPMGPLIKALREIGAEIHSLGKEGYLPVEVVGSGIQGGEVAMSGNTSSQFISGLLIAGAYARKPVSIRVIDHIVQHAYVQMTIELMRRFGTNVRYDSDFKSLQVEPQSYLAQEIQLEADASTSGYFLALAAITNGKIRIKNLSYNTRQPDIKFVDVLEQMGCRSTRRDNFIELQGTEQLNGGLDISMREMSDQTLTLAAIAPFADGPVSIRDVEHIRTHESDRIRVMCKSLAKLGLRVEEREDGMTVYPGLPRPAKLNPYDDHRVAMSLSLIGAKVAGVRIADPGCVSKTCPTFFDDLGKLGLRVRLEK